MSFSKVKLKSKNRSVVFILTIAIILCLCYYIYSKGKIQIIQKSLFKQSLYKNIQLHLNSEWKLEEQKNFILSVAGNDRMIKQYLWTHSLHKVLEESSVETKNILLIKPLQEWGNGSQCPELIQRKCNYYNFEKNVCTVKQFDAVVTAHDSTHSIPKNQFLGKIHVFHLIESHYHSKATLSQPEDLLASFKSYSDIPLPYGKWIQYSHNQEAKIQNTINFAKGKTKLVAILVSNCYSANSRLSLVKELKKYVNVDVYGDCGDLKCHGDCLAKLSKEYKFYLAFENSNCREYITEKFWKNALSSDMVPIVLGAHPNDYKSTAPPHSYIHVEDFPTISDLAKYLQYVDSNDEIYNSYFEWKQLGIIIYTMPYFLCILCGMLIYDDYVQYTKRNTNSSNNRPLIWNDTSKYCLRRGQWRWDMKY